MSTKARILILGISGVGKSSLLTRLTMETCLSDHIATEIAEHFSSIAFYNGEPIELDIVDVPGSPDSYEEYNEFILTSDMIILMYDVTSFDSFRTVDLLRQYVYNVYTTFKTDGHPLTSAEFQKCLPILLLGNKMDLEPQRAIQHEKGERLASLYNVPFFEISSLLPTNGKTELVLPTCAQLIFEAKRYTGVAHPSLNQDPSSLVASSPPSTLSTGGSSQGSRSTDYSYHRRPSQSSTSPAESKPNESDSCVIV